MEVCPVHAQPRRTENYRRAVVGFRHAQEHLHGPRRADRSPVLRQNAVGVTECEAAPGLSFLSRHYGRHPEACPRRPDQANQASAGSKSITVSFADHREQIARLWFIKQFALCPDLMHIQVTRLTTLPVTHQLL